LRNGDFDGYYLSSRRLFNIFHRPRLLRRLEGERRARFLDRRLDRNPDFEGRCWPLVIGVHGVPDYTAEIDYGNL
jgi:hypothetical protein